MIEESPFHDLTITVRLQVTDPAAVLSHPSAMFTRTGPDGETHIHIPGTIEEAVVARFTALLDQMYEPCAGLQVCEHSERLASWDRRRDPVAGGPPARACVPGNIESGSRAGISVGSSPRHG